MPDPNLPRHFIPRASAWNRVVDALRANSALTVAGGATVDNFATGRAIRFPGDPGFYAKIIGGANPYAWDYAARQQGPGGGWVSIAPGGTTTSFPAYEINGRTDVLSGEIVEMMPGAADDVRFQVVRRGKRCVDWLCGPVVSIDPSPTGQDALAHVQVNSDGTLGPITLDTGGTQYTADPAVTISRPPSGTTATATAIVGAVTSAAIIKGGSGYTSAPAVTIAAPGGSGITATAVAILGTGSSAGKVVGITITSGGSLYTTSSPTVTIDPPPPGGTQATASASANPGVVTSLKLTNAGSGYTISNSPVPTAFDLTITGGPSGLTIGPFTLVSGGTYQGAPATQDYCAWTGSTTFDAPGTATCPGLTGVSLSAELAFTSAGEYQLLLTFGVSFNTSNPSFVCKQPYGQSYSIYCLSASGATNWPAPVCSCTARPFSCSTTSYVSPGAIGTGQTSGTNLYLLFGGTCPGDGTSNQAGFNITFTLSEVD